MDHFKLKVKRLSEHAKIPVRAKDGDAGYDLFAADSLTIYPTHAKLIKTDISLEIPEGYEAQVRPRSGLALKHSITVLNSPGTIDSGYRGNVGVILINHGSLPFEVKLGDRIAQIVFNEVALPVLVDTDQLSETDRGAGGFGHTGV